jgi:hypothetical protein
MNEQTGQQSAPEAGTLSPGDPIPPERTGGMTGFVAGNCGHRVAASEWGAGFRNCERCGEGPDGVTYETEMRGAIMQGVARWIARKCLSTGAPDRREIVNQASVMLNDPHAGSNAGGLDPENVATQAEALADRQMETNPDWHEWAFGH